jgi:uncharacterized delta-60 repeat protein
MRRALSAGPLLGAIVAIAAFAQTSAALPGNLDPSFGGGGIVSKAISGGDSAGRTVASAPGGKIVVSGTTQSSPAMLTVLRYNGDGSLDSSFSGDGVAQIGNSGQYVNGGQSVVQSDGKIVVIGVAAFGPDQDIFVARLNTDGSPDGTFGVGGSTHFNFTTDDYPFAVALQPDGKIVIGGRTIPSTDEQATLIRVLPGGTLDPSFGGGTGKVTLAVPTATSAEARGITIGPDGSIYFVGQATVAAKYTMLAAKLTSAGAPDTSFNGTGFAFGPSSTSGSTQFKSVSLQADGKLLASGAAPGATYNAGTVTRFLPNGAPDPGFGSGGTLQSTPSASNSTECNGVAAMPNGRIAFVCSTYVSATDTNHLYAARVFSNGSADPTFGNAGVSALSAQDTYIESGALAADGSLLAAGSIGPSPYALAAARFDNGVYTPTATIGSPSKSKLKAKKLKKFSGTAAPAGFVTKVEIAVRKLDAKLLKKKKQCLWLSSPKAKFSKVKDKTKKCATPKWRPAVGTAAWSYKLKKRLKPGKYKLFVRITLVDGTINSTFDKSAGTLKSFTLKK